MKEVKCSRCSKNLLVDNGHYKRNLKYSYNFYCSIECKKDLIENRFWSKVNRTNNIEDCWNWKASGRVKNSYGTIKYEGKHIDAHRLSYLLANNLKVSDLTSKDYICHKCDNPKCVNPNHLFLGNAKINAQDAYAKGRMNPIPPNGPKFKKGSKPPNAVLTDQQVREIKYLLSQDIPVNEIASTFNISRYKVSDIRRGRSYVNVK